MIRMKPSRALSLPSLPLMGIRNSLNATEVVGIAQILTTPHGDQKSGGSLSNQTLPSPHYPSWGSEIQTVSQQVFPLGLRLTTPHGDQKFTVEDTCDHFAGSLTTPHGDQK